MTDIIHYASRLGALDEYFCSAIMQKLTQFDDTFFKDLREYLQFVLERSGKLARNSDLTMQQLT